MFITIVCERCRPTRPRPMHCRLALGPLCPRSARLPPLLALALRPRSARSLRRPPALRPSGTPTMGGGRPAGRAGRREILRLYGRPVGSLGRRAGPCHASGDGGRHCRFAASRTSASISFSLSVMASAAWPISATRRSSRARGTTTACAARQRERGHGKRGHGKPLEAAPLGGGREREDTDQGDARRTRGSKEARGKRKRPSRQAGPAQDVP